MDEDGRNWDFFEVRKCWLITSTENQEYANKRIPHVLQIPAAVHGISAEPLLGEIDLSAVKGGARVGFVETCVLRLMQ
jgi:protein gp37